MVEIANRLVFCSLRCSTLRVETGYSRKLLQNWITFHLLVKSYNFSILRSVLLNAVQLHLPREDHDENQLSFYVQKSRMYDRLSH